MAGILDAYQFDPSTYSGSVAPPGWLGLMLGAPVNQPTRYSPTPDPFPGIDLPQNSQPTQGTMPPTAPAPGGGLGSLLAGLFGPSQANAQPLQQAPQAPGIGGGDRAMAALANFSNARGLLPAITGAITGGMTGQRTDPAGMLLQQQAATYRALVGSGVPPAVAQAAALNPEVMKTIAPQLYSKPTLVETGTDPLTGQKSYAWQQPDQMKISPAISNGAPVGPASAPGMPGGAGQMQQIADAVRSGAQGEQFLGMLPNAFAQQVKMIADGRAPYPSGFMLKTPYGQMLTQALSAYRPDMTAQDYSTKLATEKAFDVGQEGKALKSVNQAILHAQTLVPLIDKLGNYQTLPAVANPLHQLVAGQTDPEYQSNLTQFRSTVNALASELTKAFRGNSGAIQDVEHWRQTMDEQASPAALKGGIQGAMKLLGGAIDSLGEQYNKGTRSNREPLDLVDPKNRAIYQQLLGGGAPAQAQQSVQAIAAPAPAIAALKQNPSLAAQFDAKYGAGSSAKVLGR